MCVGMWLSKNQSQVGQPIMNLVLTCLTKYGKSCMSFAACIPRYKSGYGLNCVSIWVKRITISMLLASQDSLYLLHDSLTT